MSQVEKIKQLIESKLLGSSVSTADMTGTDDHIDIIVVSPDFAGKSLIAQHQMVMDVLKENFKESLHAIKLKTKIQES
jgi:stress-induced morphogen